jgi:TRAP-type mannitol/chloroaromatic compound transport system substrate-binding protein
VNPDGENPYQKYNDQLYADMGVVKLQCKTGIRYTEAEYMATKPLIKPADFKGLTFRALGWTSQTAIAFGAKGVFIPNTDIYSALQTGVIDAAEAGDVYSNFQQGYYDICKYTGFPGIHTLTENSDVQVSKAASKPPIRKSTKA